MKQKQATMTDAGSYCTNVKEFTSNAQMETFEHGKSEHRASQYRSEQTYFHRSAQHTRSIQLEVNVAAHGAREPFQFAPTRLYVTPATW